MVELYRTEIDNDHRNTERTKLYKRENLVALKKAWPGFFDTDIARTSQGIAANGPRGMAGITAPRGSTAPCKSFAACLRWVMRTRGASGRRAPAGRH
jgi:hypothetical protein